MAQGKPFLMTNENQDTFYCIPKIGAAKLAQTKEQLNKCDALVDSMTVAYYNALETIDTQDSIIHQKDLKISLLEQNIVDTNIQLQKEVDANLRLDELVQKEALRAKRAKRNNKIITSFGVPVVVGLGATVAILVLTR